MESVEGRRQGKGGPRSASRFTTSGSILMLRIIAFTVVIATLSLNGRAKSEESAEPLIAPPTADEDLSDEPPPRRRPVARAEQERRAVWNSPEMLAARVWLEDYFRASRRYDARAADEYLARLERLEADEMRLWIARLERARRRILERQLALDAGRRFQRVQAEVYQQQRRQNLERIAAQEAARARFAQQQLDAERDQAEALFRQRTASRDETLRRQFTDGRAFALLNFLDQQEIARDLRALRAARESK